MAPVRGALTARLVLASLGVAMCGVGATVLLVVVNMPMIAGVLAFLGLVMVVDLVVVMRRKRAGEPG